LAVGAAGAKSDWTFTGELDNDGDSLLVVDAKGRAIHKLSFGDSFPWPSRADGNGSSFELIDPTLDADNPKSWRESLEFGGNPGVAGLEAERRVVINEVLANPLGNGSDFIELFNATTAPVDIGNGCISDSRRGYFRYQIELPTNIPPRGHQSFIANELGFGLSARDGEELFLTEAAADGKSVRFVDTMEFGPTAPGISLGRWPDGDGSLRPLRRPSPGDANPPTAFIDAATIDAICQALRAGDCDSDVRQAESNYVIFFRPTDDGIEVARAIGRDKPGAFPDVKSTTPCSEQRNDPPGQARGITGLSIDCVPDKEFF
jgi:hypothetical protein